MTPSENSASPMLPATMPQWLRTLFLVGTALTAILFAMVFAPSSRGYGGPGGWGDGILYLLGAMLLGGLVFWSFMSWLIYRARPGRTHGQRVGITLLFFLLPPILLAAFLGWYLLKGKEGLVEYEPASEKAVTLAGVVFPAGSELEYVQDGHFGRTLLGATASAPVRMGSVQIRGIRLANPPDESELRLTLAAPQMIDGWYCRGDDSVDISRQNGNITLRYCQLAGQTIGNTTWPAGTMVNASAAGWSVYASSLVDPSSAETCSNAIQIAGKAYVQVMASYDQSRKSLTVSDDSTPCANTAQTKQ